MKKKVIINIVKIAFSVLFIVFLFLVIDINALMELFLQLKLSTVLICGILYILINLLRTARFCILNSMRRDYLRLTAITLTHGIYNRVLPLRLGEGIYPYLMKKHYNTPISDSIINILVVRIFDLLSTAFLFVLSFTIFQPINIYLKVLFVICSLVIAVTILPISSKLFFALKSKFFKATKSKVINKISVFLDNNKKKFLWSNVLALFSVSIVIWAIMFFIFQLIFVDFNINMPTLDIYIAGSFSNISSILPISSLGNFGTMELGWSGILVMIGYAQEQALLSGFAANLFTFSCTVILGLIGMLILKIIGVRENLDDK